MSVEGRLPRNSRNSSFNLDIEHILCITIPFFTALPHTALDSVYAALLLYYFIWIKSIRTCVGDRKLFLFFSLGLALFLKIRDRLRRYFKS